MLRNWLLVLSRERTEWPEEGAGDGGNRQEEEGVTLCTFFFWEENLLKKCNSKPRLIWGHIYTTWGSELGNLHEN